MEVLRFISQTEIPMQDDTQIAHDEALQAMDMRLQQHITFCTIERCGYDDRTENAKLCLSAHLLVPKDMTKIAEYCRSWS